MDGSYTADSGLKVTHAVMTNFYLSFYGLDNKIFNNASSNWFTFVGVNKSFEGNEAKGIWLRNSHVNQDSEYQSIC